MRDIILLVAALLLVVGGVAFGAMQLGLFGGSDAPATASNDVAPLVGDGDTVAQVPANSRPDGTSSSAPTGSPQGASAPSSAASQGTTAAVSSPAVQAPAVSSPGVATPGQAVRQTTLTPTSAASPQAQAAAAPALPENPSVFFRCTGAAQVCSALRSAMTDALGRHSLRPVGNQAAADIVVSANANVVDESSEQLFGSTFVTRTYAIEFEGEARGGDLVPMPPTSSFTFDAQVGQQRLNEQSQTMSMAAAGNVRAFWRTRLGN